MANGLPTEAPGKRSLATRGVDRYGARVVLLAVAVVLVGVPFGVLLEQVLTGGRLTRWDSSAADWLHRQVAGHTALIDALQVVSFLGKPVFLGVVIGAASAFVLWKGRWHLAAFLVVTSVAGGLVDTAVKVTVDRARPAFDEPIASALGKSFPSGHAMSSVFCYGALVLVFLPLLGVTGRRLLVAGWLVLVVAIGVSRLALGVHFVTDVAGGWVLGLAWLAASVAAWEIWRSDRGLPRTDPLTEGVEPEEAADLVAQERPKVRGAR